MDKPTRDAIDQQVWAMFAEEVKTLLKGSSKPLEIPNKIGFTVNVKLPPRYLNKFKPD